MEYSPYHKALTTGEIIDLNNPHLFVYDIKNIATLLRNIKRFNGVGISVEEHSINVALMVLGLTDNKVLALYALLHDAAEAYIGDVATPVKKIIGTAWYKLENHIQEAIIERLIPKEMRERITEDDIKFVKAIDSYALALELVDVMPEELLTKDGVWRDYVNLPDLSCVIDPLVSPHTTSLLRRTLDEVYTSLFILAEQQGELKPCTVTLDKVYTVNVDDPNALTLLDTLITEEEISK